MLGTVLSPDCCLGCAAGLRYFTRFDRGQMRVAWFPGDFESVVAFCWCWGCLCLDR